MSKHHKLFSVIRHEYLTIVKQPSFWISLVAVPLLIGVVMLINLLTDADKDIDPKNSQLSVAVIDNSGLLNKAAINGFGLTSQDSSSEAEAKQSVQLGKLDGLIIYPRDVQTTQTYQVFSDDTDDNNSAVISEIGKQALQQSILEPLDQQLVSLATTGGTPEVQAYKNGEPTREFVEFIVPASFLVLFYIVLVFSVSYALYSVSEEKENRSIEMVLSYVQPRTLILGKLLGIIAVTFTQIAIIAGLGLVAYGVALLLGNDMSLPFDLAALTFIPSEIALGFGFVVAGFIFYVALMAMIGAIFPSSKEAGGFSSVFFILPAIPFWGIDEIINEATGTFTQILTYFPLTSPTTVLFRNTIGNLSVVEGLVSLAILVVATMITIFLAARAFKLGTLEYTDRIKLSRLLRRGS